MPVEWVRAFASRTCWALPFVLVKFAADTLEVILRRHASASRAVVLTGQLLCGNKTIYRNCESCLRRPSYNPCPAATSSGGTVPRRLRGNEVAAAQQERQQRE